MSGVLRLIGHSELGTLGRHAGERSVTGLVRGVLRLIGHSELGTLGRPGERSVTVNRTQ